MAAVKWWPQNRGLLSSYCSEWRCGWDQGEWHIITLFHLMNTIHVRSQTLFMTNYYEPIMYNVATSSIQPVATIT